MNKHQQKLREGSHQRASDTCDADLGVVLRALDFAAHKHRDQRRKDAAASPYINHPITLANILWQEGGVTDPSVIAAALLHDTIEDTETHYNELRGEFGDEIADVVLEVTDLKWLDKDLRKRLQIARAGRSSGKAKLLKLADKIANLRDILASPPSGWSLDRRQKYFDWAKEVVDQVRGAHKGLERRFDELYRQRPRT
jgi:guanosine-3',5'-bis(diphosphate) 3'-pyrophosphohydrolase